MRCLLGARGKALLCTLSTGSPPRAHGIGRRCGHRSDDDDPDLVADARAVLRDEASLSRSDPAFAGRRLLRGLRRGRRDDRARALDRADLEGGRRRAPSRDGRRPVPCARRIPLQADRAAARGGAGRAARGTGAQQARAARRRARRDARDVTRRAHPGALGAQLSGRHYGVRRRHRARARRHLDRPRRGDRVRRRVGARRRAGGDLSSRSGRARRRRPRRRAGGAGGVARRRPHAHRGAGAGGRRRTRARADRRLLVRRLDGDAPRARCARARSCGASACSRTAAPRCESRSSTAKRRSSRSTRTRARTSS